MRRRQKSAAATERQSVTPAASEPTFGRPEFLLAGRVECLALFPEDSAGNPIVMDAFSEVLSGVKLKGALFFSAEFSAPWAFSAPSSQTLASSLAPGAPHLVIYHLVVDG